MNSQTRIRDLHENTLKLRPFWLGDFSYIHRLHTAIKKRKDNSFLLRVIYNGTEKVLKIFSPITNSVIGFKNILKKTIFKTFSNVQKLEDTKEEKEAKRKLKRFKYRKNLGKKSKECVLRLEGGDGARAGFMDGDAMNKGTFNRRYFTRQAKQQGGCRSCQEDRAACKTCSSCFYMDPSLPLSSCTTCIEKGPVVNLCTRFHNKQPVVHLPENAVNEELCEKLKQRRETLKMVSKFCKGDSPKINHCPMCSSIKPQVGECSCKNCSKIQPIVKLEKRKKNTVVEMCPCQHCSSLRPKVKVCDDCRSAHLNKARSYYVILSSK